MRCAHRRDREGAAPAVGVEHRQRPQLDVVVRDAQVRDEVVGVDVAVAVREHHALRTRRRAGRVVDRRDVVLVLLDGRSPTCGLLRDQRLPVGPAVGRVAGILRDDPLPHRRQAGADLFDHADVLMVDEQHRDAGVVDDVLVVGGGQAEVERHKNGADLCDAVVALEEEVRVGAEDAHPIAGLHAERAQRVRELVHPCAELRIRESPIAVDDGSLRRIEADGAAQKVVDQQRYFHGIPSSFRAFEVQIRHAMPSNRNPASSHVQPASS